MRTVLLVVLVLTCVAPVLAADPPAGVVRISATYPGADARTVDETVFTQLFMQMVGVEGLARMESEARNDGTGTFTVYFQPGVDLNLAQAVVQNRANRVLPSLPAPCQQLGLQVGQYPVAPPAFLVAFTGTDKFHDARFLGNFATIHLKPPLARERGVADVRVVGFGAPGVRVWLKTDRLRAYRMTVGDVVDALRRQNTEVVAGGTIGGQVVTASGRLTRPEQFENVILRTKRDGFMLEVKDVAEIEKLHSTGGGWARVNGKPAALLAVTVWPGRVTADRLLEVALPDEIRPPGTRLSVVVDRAAGHLLEVEVRLPDLSLERTGKVVERAEELIHGLPGKPDTVAFAEGHAPNAATILVKLPAKGGPSARDVEKALAVLSNVAFRVGTVQPGGEAFPVRFAVISPIFGGSEEVLREAADRVLAALKKDPGVVNPAVHPGPAVPHLAVNVDRDKCAKQGVELDDIFTTLQAALGGVHATKIQMFGKTYPVTVQAAPEYARQVEDLMQLMVRSSDKNMIQLEKLLTISKSLAPSALVRVNGIPAFIFTAAPADGTTRAEAAALCVKLAQKMVPKGYKVKDLTDTPW